MSETKIIKNNMELGTILFLIFLVLKLTDNIDWSWWWVTSPLWIPILFVLALGGIGIVIVILSVILSAIFDR